MMLRWEALVVGLVVLAVCVTPFIRGISFDLGLKMATRCSIVSVKSAQFLYFILIIEHVLILEYSKQVLTHSLTAQSYLPLLAECAGDKACVKTQLVIAMTVSLTMLFGITILFSLLSDTLARDAFCTWMPLKFAIGTLLFTALLFVPRSRLDATLGLSAYSSIAWLIIQFSSVVDFAYTWNEHWVGYAEDTNKRIWLLAIVAVSMLFVFASLTIAVSLFIYASSTAIKVSTVSLFIMMTILTTAAVTDRISHGALLPSAIVIFYAYYQLWSSVPARVHSAVDSSAVDLSTLVVNSTDGLTASLASDRYHLSELGTGTSMGTSMSTGMSTGIGAGVSRAVMGYVVALLALLYQSLISSDFVVAEQSLQGLSNSPVGDLDDNPQT
eukprot:Lankesteria_metandrocarpae@DN986_c0_g1_i1.p1